MLILSRGRAGQVTTVDLLPEWVEMLVPDDEAEIYGSLYPNPILTIPKEVMGLGFVRNWVLDHFDDETIIMIDDDIKILYCITMEHARRIKNKGEVVQILINSAVMAKDMGVHVFGYTQTDIRKFNGTMPFSLCGWVGCVIGVIGRKYRFRDDYFKVDIDFCLQNLLVDRILFIDNRYYFYQNRDNNVGGNSIFRTKEGFDKSVRSLKEKWGDNIKLGTHKSQIRISLDVKRRQQIEI